MNSLKEISQEIYKTINEIITIGYRKIDKNILERLELLQEKTIEYNMEKGEKCIGNLIKRIKAYEKEKNHITNDELAKQIMELIFYSENIIKYNDLSEL
jgi:hypothetical protein